MSQIQLNEFERAFLDCWLVESGVNAYVDGNDVVFEDADALSQYAILTTGNEGLHRHGIDVSAVPYSDTFKRMIVVHGLCAVDVANRRLASDSGHGLEAMKKIAGLAVGEIVEVHAATCHSVRPLVDEIMGRWMNDPAKAEMISAAAGDSEPKSWE